MMAKTTEKTTGKTAEVAAGKTASAFADKIVDKMARAKTGAYAAGKTAPAGKIGVVGAPLTYDRPLVVEFVLTELKKGRSLNEICTSRSDLPHSHTFMEWVLENDPPGLVDAYARAREFGYRALADEIIELTNRTHEWVTIHKQDSDGNYLFDEKGEPVLDKILMPLNSDVIAHRRLQIDTRKWILSKVLPKIYGDKVTQELVGANGGPIAMTTVNVKNLTDMELQQMEQLMLKASKTIEGSCD